MAVEIQQQLSNLSWIGDGWTVVLTAERPQERGIHVHVYKDGDYLIDDTFGVVRFQGKELSRAELLQAMVDSTIN